MLIGETKLSPYNPKRLSTAVKNVISPHIFSNRVANGLDNLPKITFIGLGQGGNRMASEASTFGYPSFLVNSSLADMKEHHERIPDSNRIYTPGKSLDGSVISSMQGTGKNAAEGLELAKENKDAYVSLFRRDEVMHSDFVFLCASLGGGTGTGAINWVAKNLYTIRKNIFEKKNGFERTYKDVGLIISLPSSSEKGSAYRRNALWALKQITDKIESKEIGSVFVIDNEYIAHSPATVEYNETHVETVDSRTLSNAYTTALITELLSFLELKGNANVDSREFFELIGTPGYLNIKRILNDSEIVDEFNKLGNSSTDRTELERVVQSYISKFIESQDVLCEHDKSNSLKGIFQTIEPNNFNTERSKELADSFSSQLGGLIHFGSTQMQNQKGLSMFTAYVTSKAPERVLKLKEEFELEVELEKKREEEAKKNKELFNDLDFSSEMSGRKKVTKTFDNDDEIFALLDDEDDNKVAEKKLDDSDLLAMMED